LDDITLGDTVTTLVSEIKVLKEAAYRVGLTLNHSRCEIRGLSEVSRSHWSDSGLNFIEPTTSKAMLLGAPLHTSGFTSGNNLKHDEFTIQQRGCDGNEIKPK